MATGGGLGKRVSAKQRRGNGLSRTGACAQCRSVRTRKSLRPRVRRHRTRRSTVQLSNPAVKAVGREHHTCSSYPDSAEQGQLDLPADSFAGGLRDRPARERDAGSGLGKGGQGDRAALCRLRRLRRRPPRQFPLRRRQPLPPISRLETWIPLSRWCKANGLAAPCPLTRAPAPGLRAEHDRAGFLCCAPAARWRIGTGWKSGWGSRRR